MPPGAPFNSFLNPYPIRVDAFATPIGDLSFKPPALHLLTHTHSDHIVGLSSQSFAGLVVCSETAKEMLLRYEVTKDRINYDNGVINHKRRSYSHLRIDSALVNGRADHSCARDLLVGRCQPALTDRHALTHPKRAIPLNTPTEFELSATLTVRITAIDANHCPGAVM
jgi:Cft2 family RNA processing exonuclease